MTVTTRRPRSKSKSDARTATGQALQFDPLWYKDAVIYQTHVRAYFDSDGDGIGDFAGLTAKLDYLQDLGVSTVWILPFYPSPLRDDGYDIADYTDVNPSYGSLRDVRAFVREAHRRGLRVITELVCNHTSDQHPWFQRSRHAKPGSAWRDFYVWSDTPERYQEARIIFKDFETSNWTWDPVAGAYYWHRFYSHQPDLNFENPRVHDALLKALDFWLDIGVDGLRLDAIPYLYEAEGTNCENLPATHEFLKKLRAHVDQRYPGRMLLAEANQWPEDAVAYFGQGEGDECNMSFHFPLMPRMFMSIRMEDRFPIVDILNQTPPIPETAQWAIFLRNHDELTLEMVTDEERDYMYRVYAHDPRMRINLGIRRRLAPLLGNNRRRIELMNGLLFSLPGTPVIYYGDEIGMGDNIFLGDRNGVRTPMQWNSDRNAGFSTANRQSLYFPVIVDPEYHYEAINVEAQQANPHSLLWWMKRLIALRKRYRAFSRGSIEFLHPDNRKVLAFVRRHEDQTVLVVANLSRFVQAAELDLSPWREQVPVELFGRIEFPPIGELPYFVTLGPHAFYWFSLEPQVTPERILVDGAHRVVPRLTVPGRWEGLVSRAERTLFADLLPAWLRERPVSEEPRRIKSTTLLDAIPVQFDGLQADIALVQVEFTEGDPLTLQLPVAWQSGEEADHLLATAPETVIAGLQTSFGDGLLYDASYDPRFGRALLSAAAKRRKLPGDHGQITTTPVRQTRGALPEAGAAQPARVRGEQRNTSLVFGERAVLKLYRTVEQGVHPEVEVGRALAERGFANSVPLIASIDYQPERGEAMTLGVVHRYLAHEADAWDFTLDHLRQYFDDARAEPELPDFLSSTTAALLDRVKEPSSDMAYRLIDTYLEDAERLGRRTAEMHHALSDRRDPHFAPEAFTLLYQRSVYQSMRSRATETLQALRKDMARHPPELQHDAQRAAELQHAIEGCMREIVNRRMDVARTRTHGDYHLGQVLATGSDFVIIDFEGRPDRTINQRRLKRSPLRDVAGMLHSFREAAAAGLRHQVEAGFVRPDETAMPERWMHFWYGWVAAAFLRGYLEAAGEAAFVPRDRDELRVLLDAFRLDRAVIQLRRYRERRPQVAAVALRALTELVGDGA